MKKIEITVGLVEDHLLFRSGIKAIINSWPNVKVVFESPNGYSVLEQLTTMEVLPDVFIIDLSLPKNNGVEYSGERLIKELKVTHPSIKVLVLSVSNEDAIISQLIEAGAQGFLLKDCDPDEVKEAIFSVYYKGTYINQKTLLAIQKNNHRKVNPIVSLGEVTKREIDILQLTCKQYTADEIAEELSISVKTVNGHRNNLLQKTGSKNVTGLVLFAVKHGIIDVD